MPKGELSIWESKEGIRRLSIVAGIVGLILWTIFFIFGFFPIHDSQNPWGGVSNEIRYNERYIIGLPFSYILPWGFIKLIKWILDGFRQKEDIKEINEE
jgi:hypothetical protein